MSLMSAPGGAIPGRPIAAARGDYRTNRGGGCEPRDRRQGRDARLGGEEAFRSAGSNKGAAVSKQAVTGPLVVLTGDFKGRDNFIIQGRVAADVALRVRNVTVAKTGSVRADIHGATICVEGEVRGNLVGDESVIIRPSGRVRGDVTAPSIELQDGALLRGRAHTRLPG